MTYLGTRSRAWNAAFWTLLSVEAAAISWLNRDATAMLGLVPYYRHFAQLIGSGFPSAAVPGGLPTFPMWGYGWLMVVLPKKISILIFQQLLGMAAVWTTLFVLRRSASFPVSQRAFKLLMLASPAWFALHSVLWPNSIAGALLPISLFILTIADRNDQWLKLILLSGVLFGVVLNFRSDYLLLPIPIATVFVLFSSIRTTALRRMGLWLFCVYASLIPWGTYSHRATGHFLLSSTNGGHVFFIGLGNLPGNKWKIQADDGDSVMRRVMEERFGKPAPSSVTYESDVFLKGQFLQRIREQPGEYLTKVAHSGFALLTKGAYAGELFSVNACEPDCYAKFRYGVPSVVAELRRHYFRWDSEDIHAIVYLASEFLTRSLVLLSFLMLPFSAWFALRRRDLFTASVAVTIIYHGLLSMAGYFMSAYTSTIFLFLIVNLLMGGTFLIKRRGTLQEPGRSTTLA